jgi:hypothetical protein
MRNHGVDQRWRAARAACGFLLLVGTAACSGGAPGANPHVDHVTLPTHKTWSVVSVQPYEGLADIELVKFDWPTKDDAHVAFTLTREGLKPGDPICLDHVAEIDTFWAHPVPDGGCSELGKVK